MRVHQLVLLIATMVIGTYQKACDGQTAEMFQFNQAKPVGYVNGGVGIVDVKSIVECGHICAQNKECAFAYYNFQTCYQAGYWTAALRDNSEGTALLKYFPNATTCGIGFPKFLREKTATYKLPWKAGASFSWTQNATHVNFKYN